MCFCQNLSAIFMEASPSPNTVDHNIVWKIDGPGIYQKDGSHHLYVHNFVGRTSGPAVQMGLSRNRIVLGKPVQSAYHRVFNNLFYQTNGAVEFKPAETNIAKNNIMLGEKCVQFDSNTMEIKIGGEVQKVEALEGFKLDYFGVPRISNLVYPGPFAELPTEPKSMKIWRQCDLW